MLVGAAVMAALAGAMLAPPPLEIGRLYAPLPDRACAEWIESQNLSGVAGNVEMADAERASVL
jgi:hypothetical protein